MLFQRLQTSIPGFGANSIKKVLIVPAGKIVIIVPAILVVIIVTVVVILLILIIITIVIIATLIVTCCYYLQADQAALQRKPRAQESDRSSGRQWQTILVISVGLVI